MTSSSRVLITGAGGQLAAAIADEYAARADVRALGRADLDIANARAVEQAVSSFRPTHIINCAAYNQVDRAEDELDQALAVNAFGVRILARAAADSGATLVHYGTDFVFDGRASQPYTEEDTPNPCSMYGASKLLGEWFALEAPKGYVVRVASLFGGSRARSSVDRIFDALLEGREARVFSDRTCSPSYVVDVAAATRLLLERGAPGLYHCVSSNHCTWHELGLEAGRLLDVDARLLVPTPAASVAMRAPRPMYAALSSAKLNAIVPMPTWQDALGRYITEIRRRRSEPSSHQ
ncbi:MAG: dTDP-4-dehydrorhamnose reductase [Vicinamibacterales bacterium]|nr:dTDP-4-dehydrorhamnose reductase [Vicinamibacterales bacterium]